MAVTPPVMDITAYTRTHISRVSGYDKSVVTFESDLDLDSWEARAGGTGVGEGLLVGSGSSLAANTPASFDVEWSELTQGDLTYRIVIYGHHIHVDYDGYLVLGKTNLGDVDLGAREGVWSSY